MVNLQKGFNRLQISIHFNCGEKFVFSFVTRFRFFWEFFICFDIQFQFRLMKNKNYTEMWITTEAVHRKFQLEHTKKWNFKEKAENKGELWKYWRTNTHTHTEGFPDKECILWGFTRLDKTHLIYTEYELNFSWNIHEEKENTNSNTKNGMLKPKSRQLR